MFDILLNTKRIVPNNKNNNALNINVIEAANQLIVTSEYAIRVGAFVDYYLAQTNFYFFDLTFNNQLIEDRYPNYLIKMLDNYKKIKPEIILGNSATTIE